MICKVRAEIKQYNLFSEGAEVIAALSGGADSMALLSCLLELREEYDLKLSAAHVNHCLRGEDADCDEQFVRDYCKSVNVPLHILKIDVNKEAEKTGEGSEECGRRIRYEFFESLSETALIATAHNLNDQAETVLLHMIRGCSLNGLCGIPRKRGRIIRPLLGCARAEIEEYCNNKCIPFVTDATNNENIYRRNRIRHDILPLILNENPAFLQQISRMTRTLRDEEDFFQLSTEELLTKSKKNNGYSAETLKNASSVLRRRAVYELLKRNCNSKLEYKHVDSLEKLILKGQGKIQISGNLYFRIRQGILETAVINEAEICHETVILSEDFPKKLVWNGKNLLFEKIYKKDLGSIQKVHKQILANCVDCDKIYGTLSLRYRLPGDKIRLSGSNYSKSLKNLFQEYGIPPEKRAVLPVLCDDSGILWIPFAGVADRAAVTDETSSILCVNLRGEF